MSWVKLDDNVMAHPKIAGLSDGAFRLWVSGLTYCQRYLTDGRLTEAGARTLPGFSPRRATELVTSGLWTLEPEGWSIHDYLHFQPSRQLTEARRQQTASRVKRHRNGESNALQDGKKRESNTPVTASSRARDPVPSRPDPVPSRGREGAPLYASHRNHACCGRVCLPGVLFAEFVRKRGGDPADGDAYVRQWFAKVNAEWSERDEVIGEDSFAFFRARWQDDHGTTVANALPKKTAANLAVAERFLSRGKS